MPNAVEIKKRLNAIAAAATHSFKTHKTKRDKSGAVVENNYSFGAAARAMVQEAFDLGRQSMGTGAFQPPIEEKIEVDQIDETAKPGDPEVPLETSAPEAPEAP